ncbi:trimeric intracellular cation channel family protein [Brachybacterium sp. Z12]|uniref:trimeric intracellular cation channel family protein n=1 Tax=Brachybacterium sp. Z12 TaxID=2759167 RepID=UPI00223B94BF|nr:TRIC cation channel family protein [Brachybacterium sp. Z12]
MDPLELLITNDVLRAMDLLGVFVMGVAAGALASRLNFDAVGFAIIGIAAGLGGGIVRDLILDYGVPAAFSGPWYLACALGGAAFSFTISTDGPWWRRLVTVLDIAAMGLWAATGTAKSLGYGLDVLPAILLGVASAVGGGVIRDVLVGRIPAVFGGGPLYATGALVTAVLTWLVVALGLPSPAGAHRRRRRLAAGRCRGLAAVDPAGPQRMAGDDVRRAAEEPGAPHPQG